MARKMRRRTKSPKDAVDATRKPQEFIIANSKIWWEANPDKSRKYGRKEFKGKKCLTIKEAEMFLEVTGNWLVYFMRGEKGFPKLSYSWDGSNPATLKFAREDLVKYRKVLQKRKLNTKGKTKGP